MILLLFFELILIIILIVYFLTNNGYLYISTNHFEKEISIEKMRNKKLKEIEATRCPKCHGPIEPNQKICSKCINKELETYNSSNPFGKNTRKKF